MTHKRESGPDFSTLQPPDASRLMRSRRSSPRRRKPPGLALIVRGFLHEAYPSEDLAASRTGGGLLLPHAAWLAAPAGTLAL